MQSAGSRNTAAVDSDSLCALVEPRGYAGDSRLQARLDRRGTSRDGVYATGYNMIVASDATGGVAPEVHQGMLDTIFPMLGRVRTADAINRMLATT